MTFIIITIVGFILFKLFSGSNGGSLGDYWDDVVEYNVEEYKITPDGRQTYAIAVRFRDGVRAHVETIPNSFMSFGRQNGTSDVTMVWFTEEEAKNYANRQKNK